MKRAIAASRLVRLPDQGKTETNREIAAAFYLLLSALLTLTSLGWMLMR